MKILLVDDEPCVLAVVGKFLSRAGHSVEMVGGAEHALDSLNAQDFEAVITDFGMPETDGVSLARAIKARKPTQIVILLTGEGYDGMLPPNIDFVLEKPPKWQALEDVLDALPRTAGTRTLQMELTSCSVSPSR
jgi:DNA-binding NtrC family response regulator